MLVDPTPQGLTPVADRDAFVDLVCSDPEWLRAEFDAIVAGQWEDSPPSGTEPTVPTYEPHPPIPLFADGLATPPSRPQRLDHHGWVRQRSPPRARGTSPTPPGGARGSPHVRAGGS